MIGRGLLLIAVVGLGCAEADSDAPARKDALVSAPTAQGGQDAFAGVVGDARPPVFGERDGGGVLPPPPPTPDAAAPPPMGCQAGESLGLCSVCGADGLPTLPADDPDCPPVNCALAAIYAQAQEEGDTVCTRQTAVPGASRCQALGRCHDDPGAYCQAAGAPMEVARASGPCQQLEGCIGATGPTVTDQPAGTPCEGGTCDEAGTCVADVGCEIFQQSPAASQFCGEGNDGFVDYCEYYVNPPGNERMSCAQFCALQGEVCIASFNDTDHDCRRGDPKNCAEDFKDHVCRCEAP